MHTLTPHPTRSESSEVYSNVVLRVHVRKTCRVGGNIHSKTEGKFVKLNCDIRKQDWTSSSWQFTAD